MLGKYFFVAFLVDEVAKLNIFFFHYSHARNYIDFYTQLSSLFQALLH